MTKEELQRFESFFPSQEKRDWFEEAVGKLAKDTEIRKAFDKRKYKNLSDDEIESASKVFKETEALEYYLTSGSRVLKRAFSLNVEELDGIEENKVFVFRKFNKGQDEGLSSVEFANLQKKYIAKSLGYEEYYDWYAEWIDSRKLREDDRIETSIGILDEMYLKNAASDEVCDGVVDLLIDIANSSRIGINLKIQKISKIFGHEVVKTSIKTEENK